MTLQEFKGVVKLLRQYYRDNEFTEEVWRIYWEAWKHLPYTLVMKAIKQAMMEIKSYGKVPQLPEFKPYIERYRQRVSPEIPQHFKTLLEQEREAQQHLKHLPGEVRVWNLKFINLLLKAIVDLKKDDSVADYAERFAALWQERLALDQSLDYDTYWKLPFKRYVSVLQRINPEMAKLVNLAFAKGAPYVDSH